MLEPLNIADWSAEACVFLNKSQLWEPSPGTAAMCVSASVRRSPWDAGPLGASLLLPVWQDETGGEEWSFTWTCNPRVVVCGWKGFANGTWTLPLRKPSAISFKAFFLKFGFFFKVVILF